MSNTERQLREVVRQSRRALCVGLGAGLVVGTALSLAVVVAVWWWKRV